MVGFCIVFRLFFDLGVLELRVEGKRPKTKCARDTGDALLRPACPSPAPLRPSLGRPDRVSLGGLFRRKLSVSKAYKLSVCSTKTPLFSYLHRRWELMSTSRLAVGRHVV